MATTTKVLGGLALVWTMTIVGCGAALGPGARRASDPITVVRQGE